MTAKEELNGKVLTWKQGVRLPGGFGQITADTYLVIDTTGNGDLEDLFGEEIELKFLAGTGQLNSFKSQVILVTSNSSAIHVRDQWSAIGVQRAVFGAGTAEIRFPSINDGGAANDDEDEEPTSPTGSLPTPDALDKSLQEFFSESLKPNAEVNRTVHCNSKWWLLLLAAVAYLTLKKR